VGSTQNIQLADARLASQARDAYEGYNQSPIPQRDVSKYYGGNPQHNISLPCLPFPQKMLQIAEVVNRRPLDNIPADYTILLPPVEARTQGDELLATNYIATTRKAAGGPSSTVCRRETDPSVFFFSPLNLCNIISYKQVAGSNNAIAPAGGSLAPPTRPTKRGEKNLKLMISSASVSSSEP
jgi:hypothetical protein